MTGKTAEHGLDLSKDDNLKKSRKGATPKNVDTYLKGAMLTAFTDEMQKLSEPGVAEVEAAISKLQKPKPWKTIGQTAALASVAAPVIEGAGRFTKGFVDAHGSVRTRVAGGLGVAAENGVIKGGLKSMTRGDVAQRMVGAGLGGGVLAAAKEGIELHGARNALKSYLAKEAASSDPGGTAPGAPAGPRISMPKISTPQPTLLRSSSNKAQRVGNTPIAARSGVTQSISGQAMNPNVPLSYAMKPKV